jgi:hypothetical protein
VILLRISRSTIHAEVSGPDVPWAAEASFATPSELADAIARLAAEAPRNGKRVRMNVALEAPIVQVRTLADLPPVKPEDLVTLVAAQANRFFRKNGAPLVTDAVWAGPKDTPVAQAAAAEEPWLEAIAAGARTAGIALDVIAPADAPDLSLLPNGVRAERRWVERLVLRRWAVAAAGAWALLGGLYLGRLIVGLNHTKRELARLQRPAAAVSTARRELRDASALIQALNSAAAERTSVAARLARISSALPDSAFLTSLTLDVDGSGVLTGLARRAADVVARLQARGGLTGARLDGPVLRETFAGKAWERFTIVFGRETR